MSTVVSIVTPTFNRKELLKTTVESILSQSYPAVEYIIVDDGSSDGTADYLDTLPAHIKVIKQQNAGQVNALVAGWYRAQGDYLAYISDDDILPPQAIETLVDHLDRNPQTVAVFPNSHLIDLDGRIVQKSVCKPFSLRELALEQQCHIGPGAVFRRSAYLSTGGWDPLCRLLPDLEFWMRLGSLGPIDFLADQFALYRVHLGSLSVPRNRSDAMVKEYFYVIDKFFDGPFCPQDLRSGKPRALANAHLIAARSELRRGDVRSTVRSISNAYKHDKRSLTLEAMAKLAGSLVPLTFKQFLRRATRVADGRS